MSLCALSVAGLDQVAEVREYWIVHPTERWVMVYLLGENGQYSRPSVYGMDEPLALQLFPDLSLDWAFMHDVA